MSQNQPFQNVASIVTRRAQEALAPYRLVIRGSSGYPYVEEAGGATAPLLGITRPAQSGDPSEAALAEEVVDIAIEGIVAVEYGGTVSAGDELTSDANGKAVATTNSGDHIIGIADVAGVAGDIGAVQVDRSKVA